MAEANKKRQPQIIGIINNADQESEEEEKKEGSGGSESNPFLTSFLIAITLFTIFVIARGVVFLPKPPAPPSPRVGVPTLFLRDGPGTQFEPRYLLPLNWEVSKLNEEHRNPNGEHWVRVSVKTKDGEKEGWVDQKYLYFYP